MYIYMYVYVYTDDNAIRNTIIKRKIHLLLHKWPALRARENCEYDASVKYK